MYRPLPEGLTIKKSPIEGLGLYTTKNISANVYIGLTHILDERFENNYLRTPLGGFYNHSDKPNVQRMVTNVLPTLKFGDPAPNPDSLSEVKKSLITSSHSSKCELNLNLFFSILLKYSFSFVLSYFFKTSFTR